MPPRCSCRTSSPRCRRVCPRYGPLRRTRIWQPPPESWASRCRRYTRACHPARRSPRRCGAGLSLPPSRHRRHAADRRSSAATVLSRFDCTSTPPLGTFRCTNYDYTAIRGNGWGHSRPVTPSRGCHSRFVSPPIRWKLEPKEAAVFSPSALGSLLPIEPAILTNVLAAPEGSRRPCSQS